MTMTDWVTIALSVPSLLAAGAAVAATIREARRDRRAGGRALPRPPAPHLPFAVSEAPAERRRRSAFRPGERRDDEDAART